MGCFEFDETGGLWNGEGLRFDPLRWSWAAAARRPTVETVVARVALERLAARRALRPVPVAVIGPRAASERQARTARALGAMLAAMGLPVLCGGRTGVMEAVAEGVTAGGGLCIGLLPGEDWREANDHVLPIATGIGKARNVLIAQAARALVAVGGELGTLTEIGFGLHFGKPVWGLEGAPAVPGLRPAASVEAACGALADYLLDPEQMS